MKKFLITTLALSVLFAACKKDLLSSQEPQLVNEIPKSVE